MSNFVCMFVCTGNICRSPMAEGILKNVVLDEYELQRKVMPIEIISAGTHAMNGSPASAHSVNVAARHDINIRFHRARQLNVQLVKFADLILTMEASHVDAIKSLVPETGYVFPLKRYLIPDSDQNTPSDVMDPIGMSEDEYSRVFDVLDREISRVAPRIFESALEKYRAG